MEDPARGPALCNALGNAPGRAEKAANGFQDDNTQIHTREEVHLVHHKNQ